MPFRSKHLWVEYQLDRIQVPWSGGHIQLEVSRHSLVRNSMDQIMVQSAHGMRQWMRVMFVGESGEVHANPRSTSEWERMGHSQTLPAARGPNVQMLPAARAPPTRVCTSESMPSPAYLTSVWHACQVSMWAVWSGSGSFLCPRNSSRPSCASSDCAPEAAATAFVRTPRPRTSSVLLSSTRLVRVGCGRAAVPDGPL